MTYRSEVDGLRAIAVLAVVLFHAHVPGFAGGFVGVDVFFVISGYLITTLLAKDLSAGSYSLLHFYERRARRILPALFLVIVVLVPWAWRSLYYEDMRDFAQSVAAVSVFSSNLLFWNEAGYWDTASELKPLLHTWSLAIEEQFYLLFPLLLLALWQRGVRLVFAATAGITLVSFAVAEWQSTQNPVAGFYLLPARAWELGVGALTALHLRNQPQSFAWIRQQAWLRECLLLAGLLMIAISVTAFDARTPFPGVYALLPTLGTAAVIIATTAQTYGAVLLQNRLAVGIGLISYSLYLWHHVLLAMTRYSVTSQPSQIQIALVIAASFVLAYLSWRFVERPFRNRQNISRRTIFVFAGLLSAAFLGFGLLGHLEQGWPARHAEQLVMKRELKRCDLERFEEAAVCELSAFAGSKTLLIGDSHSTALAPAMRDAFQRAELALLHVANSGCPPVLNVYRRDHARGPVGDGLTGCAAFNAALYAYIEGNEEIENVVLSARWTMYLEGSRFDNEEGGREVSDLRPHLDLILDGQPRYHAGYEHRQLLAQAFRDSIRSLTAMGKKVILVYPVPEVGWNVPRLLHKHSLQHGRLEARVGSTSAALFQQRNMRSYAALDAIGDDESVSRIYPARNLCDRELKARCVVHSAGVPLYRDDNHLSSRGAMPIAEQVIEVLAPLETDSAGAR